MNKNNLKFKLIAVAVALCVIGSYVIYQAVLFSKAEMETQFALNETVYKTIDTTAFVVRDEKFITNDVKGTTVSFAENGERVARGDTVSMVFASSEDAVSYLKISEIEKSIKHYEELSGQANLQTLNINTLNQKIDSELVDYLESRDNYDYKSAIEYANIYRDSLTGKQIATGEELDFTEELANLKNELAQLQAVKYTYTEIKSNTPGYFISGADGYEKTLDFAKIDELTPEKVEKALKSNPTAVSEDIVGRVVESFKWYIVCSVDTDDTVNLSYNKQIYVNLPYHGIEKLPVTLHKIGDRTGEKTLLILSCDLMNENLADLRLEDVQIITEEYEGYKIPNSAIRTVDGVKGVYVVRGNLLGFRKIHIVYSTDSYTLVDNPDGDSGYIKLYDKVVTKGVELYDNKLV
ncbi:MAG: hypothetical protein IKT55_06600 [Clostridia bacterium]|nr:hypothetical protein [Clostridia bacterium]